MAKTLAQQLITDFNRIIGGTLRVNNESNIAKMEGLLAFLDADFIRNHMEDWHDANPTPINPKEKDLYMEKAVVKVTAYVLSKKDCAPVSKKWLNGKRVGEPSTPAYVEPTVFVEPTFVEPTNVIEVTEEEEPTPVASKTSSPEAQAAGFLSGLGDLLVNVVAKDKTEEIVNTVKTQAITEVKKYVEDNYGVLPKKLLVTYPDKTVEITGIVHNKFSDVLFAVTHGLNVLLVGGAGTGKNVLCEQIAQAMQLPFYFSNAVTQEYKITGFTDANGVYQETPFYKAFTNGGVFMLDEADASIADVLVILNAAIANGYMDFPAPIGNVKMHKDFHLIAAANTYGLGADYEYVGRNVLDAATLNRFVTINIDYDPEIEKALANGDDNLLRFVRTFRATAKKIGLRVICSYRNIKNMAMFKDSDISKENIIEYCLTSALKVDDLNAINSEMYGSGEWFSAFRDLAQSRVRLSA